MLSWNEMMEFGRREGYVSERPHIPATTTPRSADRRRTIRVDDQCAGANLPPGRSMSYTETDINGRPFDVNLNFCQVCDIGFALRKDGTIWRHKASGFTKPGSRVRTYPGDVDIESVWDNTTYFPD